MNGSSIIEINNLVKTYDSNGLAVNALRGVSLSFQKGEFAAIAGPSGSGKTTLLNLIGGLDVPTTGRLRVAGSDLGTLTPKELSDIRLKNIGFVFQAYNLIPVLTALENVEYILLLQGIGKDERRERSLKILAEVGLEKEANRRPKEISGGQQQRVAVARAIVSQPELVLADEPTANLDQATGAALLELMHELNEKKNITFIFSTHDPMVMDRAERLIHLTDGNITSDRERQGGFHRGAPVKKGVSKQAKKRR